MDNAVILSACRTPIGSFGGALKDLSASDLGASVIREAIRRADVNPVHLGDVIMGCVLQGGAGMNVARQAAIKAGVPHEVPAETVNRVCGSGLEAGVPARGGAGGGHTGAGPGRWHRVHEQCAISAAGCALGLSHGSLAGVRLDADGRADVRDAGLSHG